MTDRKQKGKGRAKLALQPDWSWVGTEVIKEEDITPGHRLRAAGIIGRPCRLVLQDEAVVVSDDSDAAGPSIRTRCSAKNCKDNPLCLNYIGGQEVSLSPSGYGGLELTELAHAVPSERRLYRGTSRTRAGDPGWSCWLEEPGSYVLRGYNCRSVGRALSDLLSRPTRSFNCGIICRRSAMAYTPAWPTM